MSSDNSATSQRQSLSGTRLGKYQVGAEIGQGGMGRVYKGFDPTLDRFVALKVMAPHLTWQEEFVERFLREARAVARLRHPNIVTIHDVGRDRGWYYFAMDFVEGRTVAQLIEEHGPMSMEGALKILRPLGAALDYAHRHGLVHRDIKPSNVVVGEEGRVTLMDFGIVRASQGTRLTTSGAVMGTPEYMAPEQASGEDVDPRTDQYALGVVAYEMLAGKAPFKAESTPTLLHKIVHEAPPPLRAARPDLPAPATAVIARALAKEKGQRYPTCTAFVEALEQAGYPVEAEAPSHRAAVPPKEEHSKRARTHLLGLGGVGLLIIGLLCITVAGGGVVLGLIALGGRGGTSEGATDPAAVQEAMLTASTVLPPTSTSLAPSSTPRIETEAPPTKTPAMQEINVLFEEDFENPWTGWEMGDYEGGSLKIQNGAYVVTAAGELKWMWGVANLFFTDLAIEVEATQVQAGPEDDNDYGIGCKIQPNGDGYHMVISGDGYFAIYLRKDASFTPLVDFNQSDVIRQGNATNHIYAVCDGSALSLSVNGQVLATASDATYEGGDVALMATSYEDAPTEIHFDNLVVYDAAN